MLGRALLALAILAVYALATGAFFTFVATMLAFWALLNVVFPDETMGWPSVADPPLVLTFRGQLEIHRNGVLCGEDRVIATLVDGWLHVEGLRTEFALRNVDISEIVHPGLASILRLANGTELRLSATRVISREEHERYRNARVNRRGFHDFLQDWMRESPPVGDSVLPPDGPHPSAAARYVSDLFLGLLGSIAIVVLAVACGGLWAEAAFLLLPGPVLFVRSCRDLVRLGGIAKS